MSNLSQDKPAPVVPALNQPRSWLSRLSRVTTSGRFVPEIDGFRFIAILAVFLLHDLGQVMAKNGVGVDAQRHIQMDLLHGFDHFLASVFLICGGFGVNLFFVISGFVLSLPFAEHHLMGKVKPPLKAYFLRRLTRLEPPFLVNLLIQAVVFSIFYKWTTSYTVRHWVVTALYSHTAVYQETSPINGVTWSLEVEVQFYILAPLLGYLFAIRRKGLRRAVLAVLILGIAVVDNFWAPRTFRFTNSLANNIHYFLAGFLLVDLYVCDRSFLVQKKSVVYDLVALVTGVAIIVLLLNSGESLLASGRTRVPLLSIPLPWCVLALYVACFKSRVINRILCSPPIYLIGGMCYTIYLYHGLIISPVAVVTRKLYVHSLPLWVNYSLQFVVHSAVVLFGCVIMFRLIERPCMRRDWPQRLWTWIRQRRLDEDAKIS